MLSFKTHIALSDTKKARGFHSLQDSPTPETQCDQQMSSQTKTTILKRQVQPLLAELFLGSVEP